MKQLSINYHSEFQSHKCVVVKHKLVNLKIVAALCTHNATKDRTPSGHFPRQRKKKITKLIHDYFELRNTGTLSAPISSKQTL